MTPAAPPLLEVDLGPGVRAAFSRAFAVDPSGRASGLIGVPAGDRGFNLSRVLGDDEARVVARRRAVDAWAGAPVAFARQVHGTEVHVCTSPADPPDAPVAAADALVTASHDVAVAVLVADCVPVLLADAEAQVVGAVHAGRRGLARGVVERALEVLVAQGAQRGRLRAAIGPSICGSCYEVPADLQAEVEEAVPGTASTTSWGTPALDLPTGALLRLQAAGLRHVHRVATCTFTDPGWYSHRATQATGRPEGRFAGVVSLGHAGASVSHRPGHGAGLA